VDLVPSPRRRPGGSPRRCLAGSYRLSAGLLVPKDDLAIAGKYGEHASDQWTVDELLGHARRAG
jgi:hypothetical protein